MADLAIDVRCLPCANHLGFGGHVLDVLEEEEPSGASLGAGPEQVSERNNSAPDRIDDRRSKGCAYSAGQKPLGVAARSSLALALGSSASLIGALNLWAQGALPFLAAVAAIIGAVGLGIAVAVGIRRARKMRPQD